MHRLQWRRNCDEMSSRNCDDSAPNRHSQVGVYNGDENRFRRRIVTIGFRHDHVVAISSRHKKLRCLQWQRIRDKIQIFDQRVPPLVWLKFQLFKKISLKMLNATKNDHVRLKLLNNLYSGLWVRDSLLKFMSSRFSERVFPFHNFIQNKFYSKSYTQFDSAYVKTPVEKYEAWKWPGKWFLAVVGLRRSSQFSKIFEIQKLRRNVGADTFVTNSSPL